MILVFIIVVSICQIGFYLTSDNLQSKHGKTIIFLLVLLGHLIFFPQFFYPEPSPNGVHCLMPFIGIVSAFWIFGGGAAILIHTIYYLFRRLAKLSR